jgi:hypothetical protein
MAAVGTRKYFKQLAELVYHRSSHEESRAHLAQGRLDPTFFRPKKAVDITAFFRLDNPRKRAPK